MDPRILPDPPPGFKGGLYWRGKWQRSPLRYRLRAKRRIFLWYLGWWLPGPRKLKRWLMRRLSE